MTPRNYRAPVPLDHDMVPAATIHRWALVTPEGLVLVSDSGNGSPVARTYASVRGARRGRGLWGGDLLDRITGEVIE